MGLGNLRSLRPLLAAQEGLADKEIALCQATVIMLALLDWVSLLKQKHHLHLTAARHIMPITD